MKPYLMLILPVVVVSCAAAQPVAQEPAAPPSNNSSSMIAVRKISLNSKSGPVVASAVVWKDMVYVRVRFTNNAKAAVEFGPEEVSLTQADGTLLRSISPAEAAMPFTDKAVALQATANQAEQSAQYSREGEHDLHHQYREEERNGTNKNQAVQTADAISSLLNLIGLIGSSAIANDTQTRADAAGLQAAEIQEKLATSQLQYHRVPPGTVNEGLLYFAAPSQWPVTLHILVDEQILTSPLTQLPKT